MTWKRRHLLAAPAVAWAQGRRIFREISASLYAWDLADEGAEAVLDTLKSVARVNSVYLVGLMHHERRPLTGIYFPHNPKRLNYLPEDSRAYWLPDASAYGRIKPMATQFPDFRGTDWLATLAKHARARGMRVGAEISHTVMDKERARGEFRDTIQRDIWGNRLGQLICHNHPDARHYVVSLFRELAARYALDYVQTCLLPFAMARLPMQAGQRGENTFEFGFWGVPPAELGDALRATTQGGCFCEHCVREARQAGFDLTAIRRALLPMANAADHPTLEEAHRERVAEAAGATALPLLLDQTAILDLIRFRCTTMTRVYAGIKAVLPKTEFRENAHLKSYSEMAGLRYSLLAPHLTSIRSSNYSEQTGEAARLADKRKFLYGLKAEAGDALPLHSAIGIRPKATPALIREGIAISAECGAVGITLGHYDGAPLRNLRAVAEGLDEAGIQVG